MTINICSKVSIPIVKRFLSEYFGVAHALCHVTLSPGVKNNHSYEIFDRYLPIHYATFMRLRWRLRGVLRWASPLLSNPTIFSLVYGNLTIFKMAAVRLLGFWEHAVFIMWPLSACRYASAYKILTKSDNRSMSRGKKNEFQDVELQKFQFLVTWL